MEIQDVLAPRLLSNASIPEVDIDWGNQHWEAVKKRYSEIGNEVKVPIEEIDLDHKTVELKMRSDYRGFGLETFQERKAK